ncbi:MAG: sigma-54 dependent transcriptional regulator [Gemmatimonadota bacterium]|nr:sigma-54 dependent transcriptional regulator [Gemmatimonadota bacterium]
MEDVYGTVVVVEDDPAQRTILDRWLTAEGHEVALFPDGESCLKGLSGTLPDVVCLDLRLPGIDGLETLDRIRAHHPKLPVIMLTAEESLEPVVASIRLGAFEYLQKPVERQKLLTTVRNAIVLAQMEVRLTQLQHEVEGWNYPDIVGRSERMKRLFRQMDRVAPTDVSVLIQGESGTGKELVGRALHDASARATGPYVALNCAAIPESLQESELFGHEKGAFTGATQRREGRFEQANGGTLFLDEIAELAPGMQAKLLRAIQEQRFFRVGGSKEVASDFRLLTATHRNLAQEVRAGRFREDLFFRLAVLEIEVPALRERGDDVALLASHFAHAMGVKTNGTPSRVTGQALDAIKAYGWPGNVRELQNAIQRAVVLAEDDQIGLDALPPKVRAAGRGDIAPDADAAADRSEVRGGPGEVVGGATITPPARHWPDLIPDQSLDAIEGKVIASMIQRHAGNLSEVARVLEISRSTLYRKMAAHGISRRES